jgi:Fe-S oxidoreductases
MPSLDAGSEVTFRKVNRPRKEINLKRVIEGMIEFRKIYDGQIWLEYMALKNVNDTPDELTKIKKF